MTRTRAVLLALAVVVALGGAIVLLLKPPGGPALDPDDPYHLPQLVGLAPERLGDFAGELYTGFDVYRDTPTFRVAAAPEGGGLSVKRAGLRRALCFLVALFHRSADFQPEGMRRTLRPWTKSDVPRGVRFLVAGYLNLHELSREQAGMLKGSLPAIMERLDELEGSGDAFARALAAHPSPPAQFKRIREVMIEGRPCLVAAAGLDEEGGDRPRPTALVYKITDYERASILWLYDPGFVYRRDERTAIETLAVYDRVGKRFRFFLEDYRLGAALVPLN